jgi:hypothetical protein
MVCPTWKVVPPWLVSEMLTLGNVGVAVKVGETVAVTLGTGTVTVVVRVGEMVAVTLGTGTVAVSVGTVTVVVIVGTVTVVVTLGTATVAVRVGTVTVVVTLGTATVAVSVGTVTVAVSVGTMTVVVTLGTATVAVSVGSPTVAVAVGTVTVVVGVSEFVIVTVAVDVLSRRLRSPRVLTLALVVMLGIPFAVATPLMLIGGKATPALMGKVPVYVAVSNVGLVTDERVTVQFVPVAVILVSPKGMTSVTVTGLGETTGPAVAAFPTCKA